MESALVMDRQLMPSLYDIDSPRARRSGAHRTSHALSNPQRVRTVRLLATQTDWLEGSLYWQDGRVAWKHSRGLLTPTAADLAAAQRALYQVARYPHASDRAFGDGAAWLERRQLHLDYAKRLCLLQAPDLAFLARQRSPEALASLAELLAAEALCQNMLPASPSQALVRAAASQSEAVVRALHQYLGDETLPRAPRALAAATLGAVTQCDTARSKTVPSSASWLSGANRALRQAYSWGLAYGLPQDPALAVKLLLEGGPELLERWKAARETASEFALPGDSLLAMLAAGTPPELVVELCESMVHAKLLSRRFKAGITTELEEVATRFEVHPAHLQVWRDDWLQRCQHCSSILVDFVQNAALQTTDPQVPRLVTAFIDKMLDMRDRCTAYILGLSRSPKNRPRKSKPRQGRQYVLADSKQAGLEQGEAKRDHLSWQYLEATASLRAMEMLWTFAMRALSRGQQLPPGLLAPFLQLLIDETALCWKPESLVWGRRNRTPKERLKRLGFWLSRGCEENVQPLVALLQRSQNMEVCREALHSGAHGRLGAVRYRDPALYAYALYITKLVEPFRVPWRARRIHRYLARFTTAGEARNALAPVLEAVALLPRNKRSDALYHVLALIGCTRQAISSTLPRIGPHLKYLFEFLIRTRRTGQVADAVEALLALDAEMRYRQRSMTTEGEPTDFEVDRGNGCPEDEDAPPLDYWLTYLLDETHSVQRECQAAKEEKYFWLGDLARLSAQLADGSFERFQSCLQGAMRCTYDEWDDVKGGLDELRRHPRLSDVLAQALAAQPSRVIKLIERLSYAPRLGAEARRCLEVWRSDNTNSGGGPGLSGEWRDAVILAPQMLSLAKEYVWLQRICQERSGVPASVSRALMLPGKLQAQLSHLEELLVLYPERGELAKRAITLRARIQDHDTLLAQAVEEGCERLRDIVTELRLKAAEHSVENCFRAQLESLVGRLPSGPAMNDDWLNATLLSVDIESNRKLLRRLLRALANGDTAWREQLPENVNYLRELAERGIDVEVWNGTHDKRYSLAALAGGWVSLCIEQDPLKILQMGNAFGTCLSLGGCNSFSTVTNACEANKRVIFARDGKGRIVARKLLAINAAGGLVGFHTYTGGPDEEANKLLRAIVASYAREFAARCGLKLADAGEVPRLFAEAWYDDGIVAWSDDTAKPRPSASGKSNSAVSNPA